MAYEVDMECVADIQKLLKPTTAGGAASLWQHQRRANRMGHEKISLCIAQDMVAFTKRKGGKRYRYWIRVANRFSRIIKSDGNPLTPHP